MSNVNSAAPTLQEQLYALQQSQTGVTLDDVAESIAKGGEPKGAGEGKDVSLGGEILEQKVLDQHVRDAQAGITGAVPGATGVDFKEPGTVAHLTQLGSLVEQGGPINGPVAEKGDCDLTISAKGLTEVRGAELAAAMPQLGEILLSSNSWAQSEVSKFLIAEITTTQYELQEGVANLFGSADAAVKTGIVQSGSWTLQTLPEVGDGLSSTSSATGATTVGINQAIVNEARNHQPPEAIRDRWGGFVSGLSLTGGRDINAIVQQVLRESYLQTTEDLYYYAEKVKFFNELKKKIRAEIKSMRSNMSDMAGKGDDAIVPGAPLTTQTFNMEFDGGTPAEPISNEPSADDIAAQEAAVERQRLIDEWNAKPPEHRGAQDYVYSTDYHDSDDYGKFDDQVSNATTEIIAQLQALPPEEKEALMEKIRAQGGIVVHNHVYDTDWANKHYNRDHKIAPRPGESFDAYIARSLSEAGTDFKGWVKDEEGNINMHEFDTTVKLPGYDFQAPLPPELGGTSSGASGSAWESGDTVSTKADLDAYIDNLESDLNTVGDDAQLANVDLQNMLQKQQQTMQMMSNIAKMLHDTAMAIIRKIGG